MTEEDPNTPLEPLFNTIVTHQKSVKSQIINLGENWREILFDLNLVYKLSNKNFKAKIE